MMIEVASGLSADWLNGWLAAVGVTVLLDDVQLSWSNDPVPLAAFHHAGDPPLAERIAKALPDEAALRGVVLASLPRHVTLDRFITAAEQSRQLVDWSLGSSVTDLVSNRSLAGQLPHGSFDVGGPGTTGTLVERAVKCAQLVANDPIASVRATLGGTATRHSAFGLGFDIRRIPGGVQPGVGPMVDPVVECLCFVALRLFPVRGDGRRRLQRGWIQKDGERGAFRWPAWFQPLDAWGIDALLDRFVADADACSRAAFGIVGVFQSVPYKPRGDEKAWGYGSERRA